MPPRELSAPTAAGQVAGRGCPGTGRSAPVAACERRSAGRVTNALIAAGTRTDLRGRQPVIPGTATSQTGTGAVPSPAGAGGDSRGTGGPGGRPAGLGLVSGRAGTALQAPEPARRPRPAPQGSERNRARAEPTN